MDLEKFNNDYEKFEQEHCKDCKNKDTNLCEIRRNIEGKCQCVYEKK